MIPMYSTVKFTDVYENVTDFLDEYVSVGIPTTISNDDCATLFYLLYAKYANSPIANSDINQFRYRVFATIFQYGPTWAKRLDIQNRLRNLSVEELRTGYKQISNRALNPDTEPTKEELEYINSQDVTKAQKSILGAYQELWDLLKLDVTEEFLNKFKKLFKQVVIPENTYIYVTEETE